MVALTTRHVKSQLFADTIFADLGFCAFYWYQILLLLDILGGAHGQRAG